MLKWATSVARTKPSAPAEGAGRSRAKHCEAVRSWGGLRCQVKTSSGPKRLPPLITFSTWFFSTNTSHLGALAESMVVQTPDGFRQEAPDSSFPLGLHSLFFFLHRLGPFESSEALQVPSNSNSCKFSVLSAWSRQHHADRSCNGISLKNAECTWTALSCSLHAPRARAPTYTGKWGSAGWPSWAGGRAVSQTLHGRWKK